MKKVKFIIGSILAGILLGAQVLTGFAAPGSAHSITGHVIYVEVDTDDSSGITTVLVRFEDEQTVRISAETADGLNLIYNDGEGYVIVEPLPSDAIVIQSKDVIPETPQNPVAGALVTFFEDIDGLTYDMIMEAHEENGFGVIAQALWMARKLADENGDLSLGDDSLTESDIFLAILDVKNGGDYSGFFPDDESAPTNWGQFKKAILAGDKKANLGAALSNRNENAAGTANSDHENGSNGNRNNNANGNNGNHNGNGNGNGNGNRP